MRKAISLAIDRTAISQQGEGGLEPVATNASGLVLPIFQQPAVAVGGKADTLSPHANAAAADAGAEAGRLHDGQERLLPHQAGKEVTIDITDPSSYTDYARTTS